MPPATPQSSLRTTGGRPRGQRADACGHGKVTRFGYDKDRTCAQQLRAKTPTCTRLPSPRDQCLSNQCELSQPTAVCPCFLTTLLVVGLLNERDHQHWHLPCDPRLHRSSLEWVTVSQVSESPKVGGAMHAAAIPGSGVCCRGGEIPHIFHRRRPLEFW